MATPAGEKSVALTQDLSEFLIELSIALHRHAMYPDGHPSLMPAAIGVVNRLGGLLADRANLSLGVARKQLVIEGVATDPKHPVLQELAGRLHRHHIGAIRFEQGTQVEEVTGFLRTLAIEADLTDEPLGLGPPERLQAWPHIRAYPLTYGQLELVGEGEGEEGGGGGSAGAARLWIGLARAALQAPAEAEVETSEPTAVAEAINKHERAEAYDQVIVGYLLQIADQLKVEGGAGSAALRQRISTLINKLDPVTLERLVEMSGDFAQRRKFVGDASRVFAVDAVVDVVKAAATASGQTISHSMLRLLSKLAAHADRGREPARPRADGELREQVQRLVSGWTLEDPNPDAYTLTLQAMSRAAPLEREVGEAKSAEADRLILMSLEIGAYGEPVARSVEAMIESGRIVEVLELLEDAAPSDAREAIWDQLSTPHALRAELTRTGAAIEPLEPLVLRLGPPAVDVLLDVMEESESRSVRRGTLDMVARFGERAGQRAAERLRTAGRPWYVRRNLLSLLAEVAYWPDDIDAGPFLADEDPRVRREAYRVLFQIPREHDRAVSTALNDTDTRNLRQGLAAAREQLPQPAVPLLLRRISDEALPSDLRVGAIRVLEQTRSPLARDALLRLVVTGKSILGRTKLAAGSPEVVAAVRVLARRWGSDPAAKPALEAAARSRDDRIRAAAAEQVSA